MSHKGKCPKCDETVNYAKTEALPIHDLSHVIWKGVAFLCPCCETVLGAAFDPDALATAIVNALKKENNKLKSLL